jgi:hypothetical protein
MDRMGGTSRMEVEHGAVLGVPDTPPTHHDDARRKEEMTR